MTNSEYSFLDILSIASFVIALQNLDMNITQEDMAKTTEQLDKSLRLNVEDLHRHLELQDMKLNEVIENINIINDRMEEMINGNK